MNEDITCGFHVSDDKGGIKLIRFENVTYELLVELELDEKNLTKLKARKLRKEINQTYYNKDEKYLSALKKVEYIFTKRIRELRDIDYKAFKIAKAKQKTYIDSVQYKKDIEKHELKNKNIFLKVILKSFKNK